MPKLLKTALEAQSQNKLLVTNTKAYNYEILDITHANDVIRECGEVSPTLQARANGKGVIEGKSYTLNTVDRPAVAYAVGIQPNNSTSAGGLSEIEEKSPTLSVTKLAGVCYARSGFGEFVESETAGTLRASAAEHGVSSQDVIAQAYTVGNGQADQTKLHDVAGALNCMHDQQSVMVCYPINTQIVTRSNKLGEGTGMGIGEDGDPAYTLQEAHSHGVIYAEPVSFENSSFGGYKQGVGTLKASGGDYGGGSENLICQPCSYNSSGDDIAGTLDTSYYKGCGVRGGVEREFVATPIDGNNNFYVWIARRLTPLECCRLQGYPDWWAKDLNTAEPTEEDLTFWADVFETHRKATDPLKKPKNKKAIKKWLQDPQTDSAEYKMWGNSLAIPCAYTVLAGIAEEMREEL